MSFVGSEERSLVSDRFDITILRQSGELSSPPVGKIIIIQKLIEKISISSGSKNISSSKESVLIDKEGVLSTRVVASLLWSLEFSFCLIADSSDLGEDPLE